MRWSAEQINWIYQRTAGCCHICGSKRSLKNYGSAGSRGSWEVDHSVPKARGGTDRLNNLYVACISCNRRKRDGTTRSVRRREGQTRAPLSRATRAEIRAGRTLGGAVVGGSIGSVFGGPLGLIVGAAIGADCGRRSLNRRR